MDHAAAVSPWHQGLEPPRNVRRLSSNFVVEAPRIGGNGLGTTAWPRTALRPVAERNERTERKEERSEPMERQVTTEEVKDEEL